MHGLPGVRVRLPGERHSLSRNRICKKENFAESIRPWGLGYISGVLYGSEARPILEQQYLGRGIYVPYPTHPTHVESDRDISDKDRSDRDKRIDEFLDKQEKISRKEEQEHN